MNNTGLVVLSILTPSIPSRGDRLGVLSDEIARQINAINNKVEYESLGMVEHLINPSKPFLEGGASIGEKRNQLVTNAKGKYLCFLDDDESISPDYVETLLRLCNKDADICTFRAMVKLDEYWGLVDMRLVYRVNDQFTPDYTVRRPAWHICPVRSEFAKLYEFKDINNAEDYEWIEKVTAHCTTEAHTDRIIFQYNHGKHSEADKIENHGKI